MDEAISLSSQHSLDEWPDYTKELGLFPGLNMAYFSSYYSGLPF